METGIAIGLPKGTYGRLAARSGMASKRGIVVGGGVIDADYTGEVRVILRNHGITDYEFKAGDRIAQLIVKRIQTSEAVVVDKLVETERGTRVFGSTDLGPKRLITSKEHKIMMCFLHPDPKNNTVYDEEDILTHAYKTRKVTLLSNAIIAAVQMQIMDETFLNRIRMAGKDDDTWTRRKEELSRMKERNEQLPKNWELEDGLIYYKNRLFIQSKEDLLTEITKGCHDSKVAGHWDKKKASNWLPGTSIGKSWQTGLTTMSDRVMSVNTTNLHATRSMDSSSHWKSHMRPGHQPQWTSSPNYQNPKEKRRSWW